MLEALLPPVLSAAVEPRCQGRSSTGGQTEQDEIYSRWGPAADRLRVGARSDFTDGHSLHHKLSRQ